LLRRNAGPAIAIDARFESKKPIDRTKLQTTIGDRHQIADGIDDEPGGQYLAAPIMRENWNECYLLVSPNSIWTSSRTIPRQAYLFGSLPKRSQES
jgi:hypothetical protein